MREQLEILQSDSMRMDNPDNARRSQFTAQLGLELCSSAPALPEPLSDAAVPRDARPVGDAPAYDLDGRLRVVRHCLYQIPLWLGGLSLRRRSRR